MKRFLAILLIGCLALALCGCGEGPVQSGQGSVQIVATLFPAYDFAREIAGERATVTLLVPPGAESHSFEPTAQDLVRVQESDLFFYNGGEGEAWVEELLESQRVLDTLCMLDCVDALEEEVQEGMQHIHEEHEHEEGPKYDEHVWTSPRNAMRICEALCEKLCELDPAGESLYRENLARYRAALLELDASFRVLVDKAPRRTLVFADRFPVRYFVEEYGLQYYAAFPGCAEDTEPSAKTVAFLIDKVRAEQLPAVFTIEFSNEKMADVICEDTGCEKVKFHSCHNVSRAELEAGESYLSLMRKNLESLKEALYG